MRTQPNRTSWIAADDLHSKRRAADEFVDHIAGAARLVVGGNVAGTTDDDLAHILHRADIPGHLFK